MVEKFRFFTAPLQKEHFTSETLKTTSVNLILPLVHWF